MGSKLKKWRKGIYSVDIYPSPPRLSRVVSVELSLESSGLSLLSHTHECALAVHSKVDYAVATISRHLQILGLFGKI